MHTARFSFCCRVKQAALNAAGLILLAGTVAAADIELIGSVSLPGTASDLSNAAGTFSNGTPHNQIGGFSAIEYDARRNRYLVLPDRGPADGAREYHCRFHEFEITVSPDRRQSVSAKLLASHMLVDEKGHPFVGLAAAINDQHPQLSLRLDPEGIRVGPEGTVYVCDEYGPHLFAFDATGKLRKRLPIPDHFVVAQPGASREEEHSANKSGRQTNRGFEGLAISADGRRLYAMLQGPLLQDHPYDDRGDRLGLSTRLYELDLDSGKTRELVYVLDKPSHGISEILTLDDQRILVLERDSKAGLEAKSKRIYEADLSQATDVSQIGSLPATTLPEGVRPMRKRLYLDLLDERFGLHNEDLPAKIEGLAFGPDLPDGRRLLVVCSDNDFNGDEPSRFYAFAVPPNDFPSVNRTPSARQHLSGSPAARLATGPLPVADGLTQIDGLTIVGDNSLYDGIPARNTDGTVNVVVEIPAGTSAKWEVNKDGVMSWEIRDGAPRIVNFLPYPGNYGMIPNTLSPKDRGGDGDALDVLILGPVLPRGTVARVHLIGVMKFLDKGEQDDKILAVMEDTPMGRIRSLKELNESFPGVTEIVHLWFTKYKGPGKMIFQGWGDIDAAEEILQRGIDANE